MKTKQVIVMRKFKSLRTGKYCSQAAHASLASFLLAKELSKEDLITKTLLNHWLSNSFRKITVYVETEEELLELKNQCDLEDIPNYLITDNGTTEFGVPTVTALGIGPWLDGPLDLITGHLKLF